MRKPSLIIALVALFIAPACGPTTNVPADSGVCETPCSCAERGPPDFSREGLGTPAAGADARQLAALVRANHWRTAAGIAPINANAQIQAAANAHVQFMATNPQSGCWANPHQETASCAGFTGRSMADRMSAAGYQWSLAGEVINWEGTANAAIDGWIWTVYHRQPFMDFAFTETGYGYADGTLGGRMVTHNVMDFGAPQSGSPTAPTHPVVFPVPGQTGVPPSFMGWLEGPTPPWPAGGAWPSGRTSGTVVSMHFPSDAWTVTDHRMYTNQAQACAEIPHFYIDHDNDPNLNRGSPANDVFLYANSPLSSGFEYVVSVTGTFNGAAFTRTWAFTTQ